MDRYTFPVAVLATLGAIAQPGHADTGVPSAKRIEADRMARLATAQALDIDYQQCAAVVIADAMKALTSADTVYASVIGHDPSGAALEILHKLPAAVKPGSIEQKRHTMSHHSNHWSVSVNALVKIAPGEYSVNVGYYCGSLCAGNLEYRTKKAGQSCTVLSITTGWVS
jgi:hypothetical protein